MKHSYILVTALLILGICTWNMAAEADTLTQELKAAQARALQPEIAEKILRFHILANSDSDEDQRVKKIVRDAVGLEMSQFLSESENLEESKTIVRAHMDEIVETAERTLRQEGYTYGASATLATVDFPVKTYGNYTFPAGEYEALQVTLGAGAGHNWWCVLYPNMCFQGTVYEIVGKDADEALREVLSPEEYADVFDAGDYKIRWKFLEYFQ